MMNPMQLIQMMRGGNPQQFLQQMMGNNQIMSNPMLKNAIQMYQNGDTQGLQAMAENLCKEKGISVDDIKQNVSKMIGQK